MRSLPSHAGALFMAGLVPILLVPAIVRAHTSIAANGTVYVTIQESGLAVVYELECGSRSPVDVRSRIDTNGDEP